MAGTDFMCFVCFVFNIIYVCSAAQTVYLRRAYVVVLPLCFTVVSVRIRVRILWCDYVQWSCVVSYRVCLCYVRVLYSDVLLRQIASCVVIGSFLVVSFIVYELVSLAGVCQTYWIALGVDDRLHDRS